MADASNCLAVDSGRAPAALSPPPRSCAGVDLMARDFDSLLRLMLDPLTRSAPGWLDRSEAELGMVVLELLAHAGDQVAYLQDRVALEGYLRTATQYESVRRLLRLIDYSIEPGHAAQSDLLVECSGTAPIYLPRGFAVRTRDLGPGVNGTSATDPVVFETVEDAVLQPALSRVALALDAPVSKDRKFALLRGNLDGVLMPGHRLLFEDPNVREWAQVESMTFATGTTTVALVQPLANRYAATGDSAAVVHGNRVAATHGESQRIQRSGNGLAGQTVGLDSAPLTWIRDDATQAARSTLSVAVAGTPWTEVEDFVDSEATSRHFRASRDNAGYITVHFGDYIHGLAPASGAPIDIRWRVGNGSAGHVGIDTLTVFDTTRQFADASQKITRTRNPFAAMAPRDAESLQQARLLGPAQLRKQDRAVVPDDFERVLDAGVWLNGALVTPLQSRAVIRRTGSWNTAVVSIDMADRRPIAETAGLREAFEAALQSKKMAGTDVHVEDARHAAVHIALQITVRPDDFARDVRAAVEQALTGNANAFFAPGRFRFAQPVHLSDLYAAVTAVPGVLSAVVTRFKRLGDRYPDRRAIGFIDIASLEVARCDNDAAHTEYGVIRVHTCGGRQG